MKSALKVVLMSLLGLALTAPEAEARGGGGNHSFGGSLIFASPSQDDIDTLIGNANTTAGGISTKPMGQGYEFVIQYMYRFSGSMFSLLFRPSYFMQSSTGKASNGDKYNYELSGWTLFPMFRLTPLENSFMKFYMQIGMGYGRLTGKIRENVNTVEYSGGNFGATTGLGAEFCFFDDHCFNLEGNFRYLPFERNKATSVSAGSGWASGSLSGPTASGEEVEINNRDLGTTLSGVLATIGYTFYF
jgi:opacity protein-like surface antigen